MTKRVPEQGRRENAPPPAQPLFPWMGMPRRVLVKGMQGVDATVAVTVVQNTVWLSISPPFTWEAIMEPSKVNEVIHALELARDEATKMAAANNRSTPRAGTVVQATTRNPAKPETNRG